MDLARSRPPLSREPAFNLPGVVTACLLALVAVHALRTWVLSEENDLSALVDFALIPARWTAAWDPSRSEDILRAAASGGASSENSARLAFARYLVAEPEAKPWTFLTYAALHGSWTHVVLNGVWLAAFGTPVARRNGAWRFLVLAAAATVAGAVAHLLLHPLSISPLIGASAAVSGLMAGATRFIFSPGSGGFQRPQTLAELLRNRNAVLFLGVWFGINILSGIVAVPLGITDASIAWEAHISGFLAGLLLFPLLDRAERDPRPRF